MKSKGKIKVNEDVWFYLNPKSFSFVVWSKKDKDGKRVATQFTLPYSKIKSYFNKNKK